MTSRAKTSQDKARINALTSPDLPDLAGIGLRSAHYQDILDGLPDIGWLEIHPENYFGGGLHRHALERIRAHYDLSFHCVGLSLGAAQRVSQDHLQKIKELSDIFQPFYISDHASWSASGNAHLNDLLPLPYTKTSLTQLCDNINIAQDFLGREILLENPSTYLMFKDNDMSEAEFMNEAARMTGCGLLLDINNIYVQCQNHGFCARSYLEDINADKVMEMHLAGHSVQNHGAHKLLIDTHNAPICPQVWSLYQYAIDLYGARPSLIEWDQDLPPLSVLLEQKDKISHILKTAEHRQNDAA